MKKITDKRTMMKRMMGLIRLLPPEEEEEEESVNWWFRVIGEGAEEGEIWFKLSFLSWE